MNQQYTNDDLLDPIRSFVDDNGRPPLAIEYERRTDIRRSVLCYRFGSYADAVQAAGFEPIPAGGGQPPGKLHSQWVPTDELINEIHVATAMLGKAPSSNDLRSFSEYSLNTFLQRFDTIDDMHQAADVDDYDPLNPPDAVREYRELINSN